MINIIIIIFFTPFLLFMPVRMGMFYNKSPRIKNLYSEVSPLKDFLKGLYMVYC